MYAGEITLAAPTAKPPNTRAMMNRVEDAAAPAPIADSRNNTAETINTLRRPRRSDSRPALKAPMAQPNSIEAISNPCIHSPDRNVWCRPSWVPLITPLSKPNRNPPIVATTLINTISRVFSLPLTAWFIALPLPGSVSSLRAVALSAAGTG